MSEQSAMLQSATRRFGGPFVDRLVKELGPILAEMVLQWLMTRPAMATAIQEQIAVQGAMTDSVLDFLLDQLEDNREVLLDFFRDKADLLLTLLLTHLRQKSA